MAVIITDSSCDLSIEETKELGVEVIYMVVNFPDKQYQDKLELTNEEFYHKLEASAEIPTTALINPDAYIKCFQKYPEEDIIVISLASKLSGTYQSANIAKDMEERENIYVIDSKNATVGQALLVKQAARWIREGMDVETIVERLQYMADHVKLVAIMDTLKYVVKGGRLSAVEGALGTVLNVKPIICLEDGEIHTVTKCRGLKSAQKELLRLVTEEIPRDDNYELCYVHSGAIDMLENIKAELGAEGEEYLLGGVIGTHIGPGAVGIAYIAADK